MAKSRSPHEVKAAIINKNAPSLELNTFAKTFNSLLIEKGIHQDDLADAIGVSMATISYYRNGKKEPRLSMIIKIANYLDVDCHYLMTGVKAENATIAREIGLSNRSINQLIKSKHDKRISQVLDILIAHPSTLVTLCTYLSLNVDSVAEIQKDEQGHLSTTDTYQKSVALADSKKGSVSIVPAKMLGKVILLKIEEDLSRIKEELNNAT